MALRYLLLALLLALGAPGAAQPGKPLPPGYLLWSASRRLQAGDFQLRVRPRNNLRQSTGHFGLQMNGSAVDLLSRKANQVVQNLFNTTVSYLDSTNRAGTEQQLRYLQTLWDINKVAARRLRQELRAAARRILFIGNPDGNDVFRLAYEVASKRQIQYDDETKYGLFLDQQADWEKQLAAELTALAAFAVPD